MIVPSIGGLREIQQRCIGASVRQSLRCQISDLSFRVLIPLGRLFSPLGAPSVHLPLPSLLLESADSFCGFIRSSDLDHLESILRLIESRRFQMEGTRALPTLCQYFEALSVYRGSLTDLHWNLKEDRLSLTVWSMLSYYSHARDKFSDNYPDLIAAIDARLIPALAKASPIFQAISQCTEIRESLQYLAFKKIEMQIRKLHELRMRGQEAEDLDLWGMSSLLNFEECRELGKIKAKSFLSQEEKIKQAEQLWGEFFSEDPLREQVLASEELSAVDGKISQLNSELMKKTKSVEEMILRADLTQVKKMIQGLYELEQLEVVSLVSESLLGKSASPEALIQWLILLRESFRVVLSNQCLNTSGARSILKFSSLIRDIRDYYEHPEDYALQLDGKPSMDKEGYVLQLERELFEGLTRMGVEIKKLVDLRITKIKQLLRPHRQKETQDILQTLAFRDQKQTEVPQDVREFTEEKYATCFSFAERILHKRDLHSLSKAKVEEKVKVPSRTGPLYIPFPDQITPEDVVQRLKKVLSALSENVTKLSRDELEKRLEEDLPFRLIIQRKISHSCRLLEQFTHQTRNMSFENRDEKLLKRLYQAVRNTRNFQTHDLWRKDIKGLVNTSYLLAYDLWNLFSNLEARVAPFKKNSSEEQIFKKVVFENLTKDDLEKAIDEGFDVNCYDYKGRSLLHFLADSPTETNLELARFVIAKGAKVYHADNCQMRPLHYAAQSGFFSLARLLVDAGSVTDADSEEGTPIELAQSYEHPELARYLSLTMGAQRSSNARALLDAVEKLDLGKVRRLIKRGFDPLADFQGRLPLVVLFDRMGGDVQTQIEIAKELVAAGADIDQQSPGSGETALHTAASQSDQQEVVDYLMSLNPNLSIQDFQKRIPLHHAAIAGGENWVNALLAKGSPVNLRDSSDATPLLIAANRLGPSRPPAYSSSSEEEKDEPDSSDENVITISIPHSIDFNLERPAIGLCALF